ncbi:MAG: hypothetical protein U9R48_10045 [Chloroflexota bacterium]|nr:hypothetical protein [Chloroflexota bacterium]
MSLLMPGLFWTFVGAGFSWLHLFLLRQALGRVFGHVADQTPADAGRRMVRGLPLRLVLLMPFLLFAVQGGIIAAAGLILGSLLGRLFLVIWARGVL